MQAESNLVPRAAQEGQDGISTSPIVTIGMPTYNRAWSLPNVLNSVLKLDYDKSRIRIAFVDNQSTDGTRQMLEEFRKQHEGEYATITIDAMKSSIPRARNQCFDRAKGGGFVFFLDSDVLPPPDTIRRLLKYFAGDSKVGIASIPFDQENARKRAGFLYRAFDNPSGPAKAFKVGNGCNIISMSVLEKVGYFNERLHVHEDGEFCFRARKKGFTIICDFSSEAKHLRKLDVDLPFYFSFMKDSVATYFELIKDGSLLHFGKVLGSLALVAAFIALISIRNEDALLVFIAVAIGCVYLNGDRSALDDGAHLKPQYRPVVGALLTLTTATISLGVVARLLDLIVQQPGGESHIAA